MHEHARTCTQERWGSYHVICQDATLAPAVLPKEELHASTLIRPQVAIDAGRHSQLHLIA